MALKKKTANKQPVKPAKKSDDGNASERLPFLRASEIDGKCRFMVNCARSMDGKYGRQIVIDGLADGEGRTWTIKPTNSALIGLLNLLKGQEITLKAVDFQTNDGEASQYIDLA